MSNDLILDLVILALGNDALAHQLVLGTIRTAIDDLLRSGIANPCQLGQLVFGPAVQVDFLACRSALACYSVLSRLCGFLRALSGRSGSFLGALSRCRGGLLGPLSRGRADVLCRVCGC